MSAFVRGMLQPLALPTHALALLALGLLISQQHARRRLLLSAAFVAGLAAGLAAIALAVGPTPAADVVLAAGGLAGLLVAIGRPLPALGCALLVAVAGAALGLGSPPQATSIAAGTIMLIGTGLGASLALALVVAGAGALAGALAGAKGLAWPRIGVRVLGSWIAASAILVLALRFARGQLL